MKFIPDRIKKVFSRRSRKAEGAIPAAADTAVAPAAEPAPAPEPLWTPKDRTKQLAIFKDADGCYQLDLNVNPPARDPQGGFLHMMSNRDTGLMIGLVNTQVLADCKAIAVQVEDYMYRTYGLDIGRVYFKRKDAEFYFDGYDQLLGLPPGDGFKLVLVPEGNNWEPPYAPPARNAIPNTSTVLQHPRTLLPQFQAPVRYPLMYVNGYNMLQMELPKITDRPQEQAPAQPESEAKPLPAAAPKANPPPRPGV